MTAPPHAIAHMLMRFSEKPLPIMRLKPSERPASAKTMPSVTQMRPYWLLG